MRAQGTSGASKTERSSQNHNTKDRTLYTYRIVPIGHVRRVPCNLPDMLEHEQYCGRRHMFYSMVGANICHTRRTRWSLPHASGRQQYCGRQQTILYPTAWAARLGSTHTISHTHVRSSPLPIKGDALSPNNGRGRRRLIPILSLLGFRTLKF